MRIAVTGADGFIGKALCSKLNSLGISYVGIDRKNYQEVGTFANAGGRFDAIVHLAAQTSVWNRDFSKLIEDNIKCFIDIVQLSNRIGCGLVYASSSCAENITSMYGMTKRFDEMFASVYAGNAVGVRFHNVYGRNPREGTLLAEAIRCSRSAEVLRLYNNGKNQRHFTYIDDIVNGIVKCVLEPDNYNGIVSICNPKKNTILEFAKEVSFRIPLDYEPVEEVRRYDKEDQIVVGDIMELDYTPIEEGLRLSLR